MRQIFQNPSVHKTLFALIGGVLIFLAFPKWGYANLIFLAPIFLNALSLRCENFKEGFWYGFLTSVVIMMGGFYWIIHVVHEFGHYPNWIATLCFLVFCGFGALNFPLYVGISAHLQTKLKLHSQPRQFVYLWYALFLPALFTAIEFVVPKLFPWSIGHALYQKLSLIQVVELAGVPFLTFAIFCFGGVLGLLAFLIIPGDEQLSPEDESDFASLKKEELLYPKMNFLILPGLLWLLILGFGIFRLSQRDNTHAQYQAMRVGVVQANIGTLEKVQAEKGVFGRVQKVLDTYQILTDKLIQDLGRPELIVWPETAMPFNPSGNSRFAQNLRTLVYQWNIPLLTGGHHPHESLPFLDYNAAFLMEPQESGDINYQRYHKNILLMFGEYLPFGEMFPSLYKWIPRVGRFASGKDQKILELGADKLRLGITVCYEAINPSFVRKVTSQGVQVLFNLTNDSWFGNTSEPFQHASLSIFRAIEARVPLVRATNTGLSFTVDRWGAPSKTAGIYREGYFMSEVWVTDKPKTTLYTMFGDWFLLVCIGLLYFIYRQRKRHAPVSV